MKLLSCSNPGSEWRIVYHDPQTELDFAVDPAAAAEHIADFAADHSTGYFISRPCMFPSGIPLTLLELIEGGENTLNELKMFYSIFTNFVEQGGRDIFAAATLELQKIDFLPPVVEPRLLWGLVSNTSNFLREKDYSEPFLPIPKGHQRPLGTVVAHGEAVDIYENAKGNVELAFIIGKKCRNVPQLGALDYVFGYSIVNDMYCTVAVERIAAERATGIPDDPYAVLCSSWNGKTGDRMCGFGPFIVTAEELGNPYDLMVYSSRDEEVLGRGHTSSYVVGIERAIQYYSSFATLYPGDVIHIGSPGKDGYLCRGSGPERKLIMQSSIERIGTLDFHARLISRDAERAVPPRPRRRKLEAINSPSDLNKTLQRNFYIAYSNSGDSRRFSYLCAPGSAVGTAHSQSEFLTPHLQVSGEFAAVINRTVRNLSPNEVSEAIAGYAPLLVIENREFHNKLPDGLFEREKFLISLNERWGDACNILSENFTEEPEYDCGKLLLFIDNKETAIYETVNYHSRFDAVVSMISEYTTLYPGDVITLGSLGKAVDISDLLEYHDELELKLKYGNAAVVKKLKLQ